MKVYLNKTSPYARLVMVVAHEKQLADRIERVWVDPWTSSPELIVVNPYAKVPVLVTDAGVAISESTCICDYLDHLGSTRTLMPVAFDAREPVLRKYGWGRGLIDCAFGATIERRFAGDARHNTLVARWLEASQRSLDFIASQAQLLGTTTEPDLGELSIAVALGYAKLRLPEFRWSESAAPLIDWYQAMMRRPAFMATAPE